MESRRGLIAGLSVLIPLIVAVLFSVDPIPGYDTRFLPPIYASINGITAVLLAVAYIAIRSGKRKTHELLMKVCMGLSATFLVMYVIYHVTTPSTAYGGQGVLRMLYFILLISHIALSVAVVPMVLFSFSRALSGNFARHKVLARVTLPIWIYVAVTGVVVYLMIRPYYPV